MWTRLAIVAVACATMSARAQATAAPDSAEETWLEVSVNGQKAEQVALFLREPHGRLLAPAAQLSNWRLRAPTRAAVDYQGEQYVPLDGLAGLSYQLDDERQIVTIDAQASLFDQVTLDGTKSQYVPAPLPPWGGFLNYDFVAANAPGDTSLSGLFEASLFGPAGAGVMSFLERHRHRQTQSIRLDTTWTTDHPQDALSFRFGDSITGASAWWGSAVRFGGIQWSSNFSTRPGLITMPLPSVGGEAAVPSTLDVYVNDSLRLRNDVPGGVFRIDDVPVITGEGDIRLVVRDLLGRERVITESYYASPSLLRAGLQDYSLEAGAAREDYGVVSDHYGRPLIVGTDRWGVTNWLTAEVHGEILRDQQTFGIAGALLLSNFGVLSASAAGSRNGQAQGQLFNLGFERAAHWLSFGANVEYASPEFTRLGLLPHEATPRLKSQLFAIAGLRRLGSVSISRTRQDYRDGHAIEILSARDSINIGGLGYLTLSVARTLTNTRDTMIALSLTHSVNARTIASATTTSDAGGTGTELDLQQSLPAGRGMGYRLIADTGETRAADATLDLQGDLGTYEVEARRQSGVTFTQASASGGFAILADHVFPSRRIDNSFAVAEVGTQPDVRLYRENQLIGRTDARGYLLLPGLRAYQSNVIRVEQADLPLDVVVDAMQVQAVPYFRSGVILRFPVTRPRGALLLVQQKNGEPLPAGALVQVNGQGEEFPSGLRGEVYVTGLADSNRVRANWTGKSCEFVMSYSQTDDPLPRLGPYVCQSVSP
ncbi:MAG: usher protein [Gammaproteobacteria bacterium]|nr:usher protein [Gammaproteobacteria bacterium]